MPNPASRFSPLARAFFRRVEAMRTLIVPALVLGLLAVPASSAHAQQFVKNFDVPRRELRAGTFGFNAYFPPPYDEYYTENGEPGMEVWWFGTVGAYNPPLTVWPVHRTLYAGLTKPYYLRYDCPFCVSGQVYTYVYRTKGPADAQQLEFQMRMRVTTFPLGAPCTKGDECINEACIDGFCCNWQCGAGVGDPNLGIYSAAPCMACSVARGATANGACTLLTASPVCTNGACSADPIVGNQAPRATCTCSTGWTGRGCDEDVNECTASNGGCHPLTSCTNRLGAPPTCGACPMGYAGTGATGCADINECATNNGGCDALTTCTNETGAPPTCGACPMGYAGTGATGCADIDECATNNGGCDALTMCTNQVGAPRTCGACPMGYAGTGATGCADINECATNNGGCDALTTCTNETGAPRTCGGCPMGYSGTGATGCADINECTTNNGGCDALTRCTNAVGAPVSCGGCPAGYTGTGVSGCVDIDECATNNGRCHVLTGCTNEIGAFPTCGACPMGYTGTGATGCVDIDECITGNGGCHVLTGCTNEIGAPPSCGACPAGYTGTGATGCIMIPVDAGGSTDDDAGVMTNDAGLGTNGDAGVGTNDDAGVGTNDDAGVGTNDDAGVPTHGDAGVVGPTPTEPPTAAGCACSTSTVASSMPTWLFALFVGLLLRRQRARATK